MKQINAFDIDGVISIGIYPGPDDVIITGRSFEEEPETIRMLTDLKIENRVFFNPLPFDHKTRYTSGEHKADIINKLRNEGVMIKIFFEDDPIQKKVIEERTSVYVVEVKHNLTEKENVRHEWK